MWKVDQDVFEAFVAWQNGKSIGLLGVWPNRSFDAKFVSASGERKVLKALQACGCKVTASMEEQLVQEGIALVRLDTTNRDTVFSLFKRMQFSGSQP